ncbi:L,D-transpeptidase [Candidatus Uhrbacteria bacterium]|nr:L,D-transpeptidase [Candidatus Uhrbacteria bacterium]
MTALSSIVSPWRSWFWLLLSATLLVIATPAYAATSTPETLDTDGDGLIDVLEVKFGTDPLNKDTDGDSFEDGLEVGMAYSPTSTEPIQLGKSIFIKLKTQTMEKRVAGIAIKSFKISGGLPKTPTPVGKFKVLSKNTRAWSSASKLWMPYWMAFSGRGHGIHELPEWPGGKKEGANHLGRPASHGCVRLGIGSAKEMYDWAPVGTPVIVEN